MQGDAEGSFVPRVAPAIPYAVLDSRGLTQKKAIALWQESNGLLYDVHLLNGLDGRFSFYTGAYHFGEMVLSTYKCVAQSFDRSRVQIGRDGVDHITLHFCVQGRHNRRIGGSDEYAGPGDLMVADLAQAQATVASDFDSLNLTVPRRLISPLLKAPDEQNLRIISGGAPLVALLRDHMQGLYRGASAMNGDEAEAIVRPTLELAAAAINAAVTAGNAASVRLALTGSIRRYIDDKIMDQDLTAELIAAAFGVSTRKLYYLFEPFGGLSSHIQEERQRRCQTELTEPAHSHKSIAEIAESYGFRHRKSFVRAFRRVFDITPREMRALAAEGRSLPSRHGDGRDMWDWIRALR